MSNIKLKIKRLHEDAIMPTYATDGSGCFDLYAHTINGEHKSQSIDDNNLVIGTGLAFEVPKGHAMMIYSRSSQGFLYNVRLSNCVGVIDSDYRGEVMVKLTYDNNYYSVGCFFAKPGDRIAQAMIVPVPKVEFVEVEELGETERGAGGFGSTGK
jgi:dUTP pyrophosphatase